MSKASIPNEFDLILYKAMQYTSNTDLDLYRSTNVSHTLSEKDKAKIFKRAERETDYASRHKKYRPAMEFIKRAAVIVLIITSIAFVSAMSVEAIRNAVWETVTEWFDEYIHFKYALENQEDAQMANAQCDFEYKEPKISDEFERYEIAKTSNTYITQYENAHTLITYHQDLLRNIDIYTNNKDTTVNEIDLNGHKATTFTYKINEKEQNKIIWNDGIYIYSVDANLPLNELLALAKTVS